MFVDVRYTQNLYDLNDYNLKYMHLYTGDDYHPDNVCHYGSKEMKDALQGLHHAYARAFEAGQFGFEGVDILDESIIAADVIHPHIWVNDMSLPWGGRFKSKGIMSRDGHLSHKWGNDVDICYNRMNAAQRQWMWDNAPGFFTEVDLHNRDDPDNIHWHLDL
jgi:hypothetical protein